MGSTRCTPPLPSLTAPPAAAARSLQMARAALTLALAACLAACASGERKALDPWPRYCRVTVSPHAYLGHTHRPALRHPYSACPLLSNRLFHASMPCSRSAGEVQQHRRPSFPPG